MAIHSYTSTAAVSTTLAPGSAWQLEEIRVHLNQVGVTGDLTVTLDSGKGAEYDALLLTQDMTAITDLVWAPNRPKEFLPTDELDIEWANAATSGAATTGIEIVFKGI